MCLMGFSSQPPLFVLKSSSPNILVGLLHTTLSVSKLIQPPLPSDNSSFQSDRHTYHLINSCALISICIMSGAVNSNRGRDSYIKRYNNCTSIICRPSSADTVELLDHHSDNAQDIKTQSKIKDESSDPSLFYHQAPDYDVICYGDFLDSCTDEDDGSSISSILEAFTSTLAIPPSVSWDYENGQSDTFNQFIPSSIPVKRRERHNSFKRCNSANQLTPRSTFCSSTVTTCPASSVNTSSHRANKSWPNRISYSTSLPLLTHQTLMTAGPKSRTSDLSTCATLVSTSPIQSTFELKSSYPGGGYTIPNKFIEHRDQIQTYGSSIPSSPGFSIESEKSSWESDDDEDDETGTINNEGTFADMGLGWPRFSRIQLDDIKRKLRIRTSNPVHENGDTNQSHSKWHEAIRKSTERKKKVSNVLRGILRLKAPTLE